ncbi:hypothetical protein PCE1_001645 [Barthelona sp. PCE]
MARSGKKKSHGSVNQQLSLVMRSGKASLGIRTTLRTIRRGQAKLTLIANNTPALTRSQIEYYCALTNTGVLHYNGTNNDLGTACGKFFRVSAMSITNPGDSDIVEKHSE